MSHLIKVTRQRIQQHFSLIDESHVRSLAHDHFFQLSAKSIHMITIMMIVIIMIAMTCLLIVDLHQYMLPNHRFEIRDMELRELMMGM